MMSTTIPRKTGGTTSVVWLAVLALLVVAGIVAWSYQLTQGLSVTGIGQEVVWGLYIATFFLLAGAASGCLFLAALGGAGLVPALTPHRASLLLAAVAGYISAGVVILMDIGHPERVLQFLTSPRFGSPFVWDFYVLALGVVVAGVYLFYAPGWMAWVAALVAPAVVITEGLLLSVTGARPLWSSPLTPALFGVEALITGASVAYLLLPDEKARAFAAAILRFSLPALLVLWFVEAVTELYGGEIGAQEAMRLLLWGALAAFFWAQVAGILLALILLALGGASRLLAGTAAGLALAGVLLAKVNLLVAGQTYGLEGAPATYLPTVVEAGSVIGVLALAALLYVVGRQWIRAES
jgi:molybdopterin-containing oxidoreductase family membrane subunit